MRVCHRCGHKGPDEDFFKQGARRSSHCKECDRASARARYHRRKAADPDKVRRESAASSRRFAAKVRAEGGPRLEAERARTRRRVRKLQGRVEHDVEAWWETVLERDPCAFCGGPGGTVEHVEAWSINYDGSCKNLVGACLSCNQRKWAHGLLFHLLRLKIEVT